MTITFRPVRVGTGTDEEGSLVFSDDRLVAVLVRLSEANEIAPGRWFYEAGFGALDGPEHPTFASLEEAQTYIAHRIMRATRPSHRSSNVMSGIFPPEINSRDRAD
jgi:hypothetical protein